MPTIEAPPDSVVVDEVIPPPNSEPVDSAPVVPAPDKGLKAIAKDAINRAAIFAEDVAGKITDPFQQQRKDLQELGQFLTGDWSGVKTQDGKTLVNPSVGQMLSEDAAARPVDHTFDDYQGDPTQASDTAPGVAFAVGQGRSAASAIGFAIGAALAAPLAPETLGAAPIAAGVTGSMMAGTLFDKALQRGAAYDIPGFRQIQNDLAAQGEVDIPGVGKITPEQIGSFAAIGPLTATTVKNLVSQATADTARRGAIYAGAKASLQGTTAAGAGAATSALTQQIETGEIDPQKTAIDTLLSVATMMPEGRSLRPSTGRVEDDVDFQTMKRAAQPAGPEDIGTFNHFESVPMQVKTDLGRHQSALPAGAIKPEFEVLATEASGGKSEKSLTTIDVQTEVSPQAALPSSGFIEHKGVAFDPKLVEPVSTPEGRISQLVAAQLSDGIRSNGLKGQRIAVNDDPSLPGVFVSSDQPNTIFINPSQIQHMANLDDYTRQIYFDRMADEEHKHLATVAAIKEAFPQEDINTVLAMAFDELTSEQQNTIAAGYGSHIGDAWGKVQGGQASPELKADMALEGMRMILQQRAEEPTTEQMSPELNFSTQSLDSLIRGSSPEAPTLSALLDRAQQLDVAAREGHIPFRERHPHLSPRLSQQTTDRGALVHAEAAPAAAPEGSSAPDQGRSDRAGNAPDAARVAPAVYLGEQKIPGHPSFHLYNLTQDIPGHPEGSTVSDRTLLKAGYQLPENPIKSGTREHLTNTTNFKKWFGDSKVVDERGKPLVVYHGTGRSGFSVFDLNQSGTSTDSGFFGKGIYFSDKPAIANDYATLSPNSFSKGVLPVFLKINRPFYWDRVEENQPKDYTANRINKIFDQSSKLNPDQISKNITQALQEMGHDGVIVKGSDISGDEFVVFNSGQIKSATGNSGEFNPASPVITAASGDLLKRARAVAKATLDDYIKPALTPEGVLPRDVFDAWHDTEQHKAAIATQGMFLLRDLKNSVKAIHGGRTPTGAVMAREMQVINDALQGKFQFKPESPLYLPVKRMRDFIDGLSDELIRSGATDSSLIPHIEAQKGFYLTRSYEAFDNPSWWKKWEKQVGVDTANRAKSIVASWVMDDWASEPGRWAAAKKAFLAEKQARFDALDNIAEKTAFVEAEGMPDAFTIDDKDAVTSALLEQAEEWTATPEGQAQVQGEINSLTRRNPEGQLGLFSKGKLGSKNLNILKRRKEIPEAVRQMMGEYKGADINFSKSATKMAALWQHHQFLEQVKKMGMGKFLFEKKTGDYFTPIAADGSKTMEPLNGLYTTEEIANAFNKFNAAENLPTWARLFQLANLYPKLAVTVWNPASIGHNAISQTSSWVMRGHWMAFNPANWKVPIAALAEREGWEGLRGLMGMKQAEARAYLDHMTQLGILESNAFVGDLAKTLQDTLRRGETLETLQGIGGSLKRGLHHSTKTHEIPNSITRMLLFEAERARYAKALPAASPRELDLMAAKAVRATTPTYSEIPRGIQAMRRAPFFGPFLSYAAENYRNYYNAFKWAYNEWKNPATRGIAISAAIGLLLYSSLFKALSKASATANNIDANDEQKFRKFLPPWSEHSQLIWLSNDGKGKLRYLDSSYITNSSMTMEPIQALLDGKDPGESLRNAFEAAGKPFFDEQIGVGAINEAYMNAEWSPSGSLGPVSNAPDGSITQVVERGAHALKPAIPGAIMSGSRIYEASKGNVTKYGQNRTVADELWRDAGLNITTLDLKQALKFKAQAFNQNTENAEQRYRTVFTREGNVSAAELESARRAMELTRQSEFNKMNDLVITAKHLGLPMEKIQMALGDAKVGARTASALVTGNYVPYRPGKAVVGRAFQNAEEQGEGKGITRVRDGFGGIPVEN